MAEKALAKREQSIVPLSPEMLIAKAIEAGTPVEALERLLAMRQTLKAEQAREAFIDAMAAFQSECPAIPKNRTANAGNYSYKYASLDAILKATAETRARHGFSHRFDTRFEDNPPAQVTVCIVSHRDGHEERSEFRSPIDSGARMNVMQQSASAQTYAKRYAFINAFGIVAEDDDDGQGASARRQQAQDDKREAQGQRRKPSGPPPGELRMPPRQQERASDGADRRLTPEELRESTCPKCGKTGTGIGLSSKPGKVACARGKGGCGAEYDYEEPAEAVQGELV